MEVICLDAPAFYALVEQVVERLKEKEGKQHDKWVDEDEALRLLNIKSKTTLQNYRNEGKIRLSHPSKKVILYDSDSIDTYLEKHAKETF